MYRARRDRFLGHAFHSTSFDAHRLCAYILRPRREAVHNSLPDGPYCLLHLNGEQFTHNLLRVSQSYPNFLPGVPVPYILERLRKADGREVSSGKLASPESSAALAVNTFGWFHDRPQRLPPFPILGEGISRPTSVEVEYCARFPWAGGRHPWLDALGRNTRSCDWRRVEKIRAFPRSKKKGLRMCRLSG